MKLTYHINFVVDGNAAEANSSVGYAKEGDMEMLAARCERGARLSDQERAVIAQVLRRELRLSANRPPKRSTALKRQRVAMFVRLRKHLTDFDLESIIADARNHFGVKQTYVQGAIREDRQDPERDKLKDGLAGFVAETERVGGIPDLPVKHVFHRFETVTFLKDGGLDPQIPPPPGTKLTVSAPRIAIAVRT